MAMLSTDEMRDIFDEVLAEDFEDESIIIDLPDAECVDQVCRAFHNLRRRLQLQDAIWIERNSRKMTVEIGFKEEE